MLHDQRFQMSWVEPFLLKKLHERTAHLTVSPVHAADLADLLYLQYAADYDLSGCVFPPTVPGRKRGKRCFTAMTREILELF